MSTNKKTKTDNKIFQDVIDFEILRPIINYLLISKNKNNNNNTNSNQYKINKFYLNRNEILNYILVSKKWYNFISLTISNNIINNKSFEHWLEINNNNNNNKSFIENYNNQNQYDKNNLIFNIKNEKPNYYNQKRNNTVFYNKEDKQNKISFNKEFSIIKIKESIIDDYFKFNLFLDDITIDDFKEIKNKFENNQLLYNRIVVNLKTSGNNTLFEINEYVSNENSEIVSNLFKILELNFDFWLEDGYSAKYEELEEDDHGGKKCTELFLINNLSISGFNISIGNDETLKIFKNFKSKHIIYDGSDDVDNYQAHANYSVLFDPDNSGQQVESIKVQSKHGNKESVEPLHLINVNQFENLHSITIPINSILLLSEISKEMGFYGFYDGNAYSSFTGDVKSELIEMVFSIATSESLKNLNITSINFEQYPINFQDYAHYYLSLPGGGGLEFFANKINEIIEQFSNSFQPLFSELNTSIERIEFDCCGLLNINTFSNLLNNKSIKYLYLYNSDFIVYSLKQNDSGSGSMKQMHKEPISINQYLFENIFSSPLTSIRHYKINFKESKQIKPVFNLILNNIFKLQLYSLIFVLNKSKLIGEFVKEFKNLINNISIQLQHQQEQQQQQEQQKQKLNNINLKEFKIKIEIENKIKIKIKDKNEIKINERYIQELNNIDNPYFTTVIKKIVRNETPKKNYRK